jgi:4-amino-4-deoxy-L-arabinose transferase-like glycosyltransferase
LRTATRHGLARFAVPAIFFVAVLLRVSTLNERGVWRDEVYTLELVHLPFTKMMAAIRDTEGTPPLYYIVAWVWARVAGSDPVGLRLLSALFGIGTVLALFYAAATLVSRRAGLIAALLGATSPLLVWYSQEARSYALGVLLITVSLWLTASIARSGTASHSRLVTWAAVCGVALTVHYFTVFVVTAEAVWLVVVLRKQRRAAIGAVAAVALVGLALVPLARMQRSNTGYIGSEPLLRRLLQVPAQFLAGPQPSVQLLAAVGLAPLAVAVWLLVRQGGARERSGAVFAVGVGFAALLVPVALSLGGIDYLLPRNLLFAWPAVAIAAACGLAAGAPNRMALAATVALCLLGTVIVVVTASEPKFGQADWRAAARAAGDPVANRLVVISPGGDGLSYQFYRPTARPVCGRHIAIEEILVLVGPKSSHALGSNPVVPRLGSVHPPGAFHVTQLTDAPTYTLLRLRAHRATRVSAAALTALAHDPQADVLVEARTGPTLNLSALTCH